MHDPNIAPSVMALRAREILGKKIEDAKPRAMQVFEQVNQAIPTDQIARGTAFRFEASASALTMGVGEMVRTLHPHALTQLAGTAGIPGAYLADLASARDARDAQAPETWKRELAAHMLAEHFAKGETASKRFLVRSVQTQVRGVLSDRFRRLDSRPLLDTFMATCQEIGAMPIDGHASDLRVAMKAIMPIVYEPVPNECLCLGVEWGNSDYGSARHSVRAFIYRLWCSNGATLEDVLSQVHLGRQLGEDIEFSQETYRLDTKASVSALRDVVRGTLGPKKIEGLLGTIKAAHEQKIDWKGAAGKLAKALTKGELKAAQDAFDSNDVVNLPEEKTMWRVSNAISWLAGKTESEDRKLELQRLAGQVLDNRTDKAA